jgi:hypothetical protein
MPALDQHLTGMTYPDLVKVLGKRLMGFILEKPAKRIRGHIGD